MALDVITAALNAVTEGLRLANTPLAESLIRKRMKIQFAINEAESRPYAEQDDAQIVALYKELKIWMDASLDAMRVSRDRP
jgi:hypothetical protein